MWVFLRRDTGLIVKHIGIRQREKKDVASLDDDVFVTLLYMRCYFKRYKEELIPENVLNL